ncbi:hypothetical protein PVL29_011031 [Vitis rotundifolia]|uniref:Uncharacterized protein n=1 Tax=Vitis rotundifolia TaxID=103349 RepID=A0AA38ZV30_VITRO|nr:hypothetical protein PVL29_011031 [Vitis rotundifolia]
MGRKSLKVEPTSFCILSREEVRKVAYDILLMISSNLGNSIMGYLSGSSPHIKSGAVPMPSLLVCEDADNCISVTDLAVLGFMKVVVSCLQAKDSPSFLTDVLNGVLPWSSLDEFQYKCRLAAMLLIEWRYENLCFLASESVGVLSKKVNVRVHCYF